MHDLGSVDALLGTGDLVLQKVDSDLIWNRKKKVSISRYSEAAAELVALDFENLP